MARITGWCGTLLLIAVLPFVGTADMGRAAEQGLDVEIVAIDLAGRQTNLTQNAAADLAPAVARDGRIVFVSTRDGEPDLYVMDGDARNVRRLTTRVGVTCCGEDLEVSQAAWSPDGGTIAFDGEYWAQPADCERLCVNWNVQVIGSDGSGVKRIALEARAPGWSPDGRRLAYESGVSAYGTAYGVTIARLDGSGSVQVGAIYSVGPVWSPGGGEIAFQARPTEDSPTTSIYVVRADGTHKRRLAAGHDPIWSPDGRRLAFIWNYRLVTIGADGKGRRRLSRAGEFVGDAAWSPNGRTLAVVAGTKAGSYGGRPRNIRLETVSADGKHERVLVRRNLSISGSPWTPDGKRILVTVAMP
jgi:Tol biopolymer transport system component